MTSSARSDTTERMSARIGGWSSTIRTLMSQMSRRWPGRARLSSVGLRKADWVELQLPLVLQRELQDRVVSLQLEPLADAGAVVLHGAHAEAELVGDLPARLVL